jgi:hypothetical protein
MAAGQNPLLDVFRNPALARGFSVADWNLLLRQAKRERLVARLGYLLEDVGLLCAAPPRVEQTCCAARAYVEFQHGQIALEVGRIARALRGIDAAPVLLKGAAYLKAGLPLSRGRRMSDVDILVPRERIALVEERLLDAGWEPQKLDSYDQRYYREWMHEIPPLRHPEHGIEIDIHHALLPLTARVRPDPTCLRDASMPVGDGAYRVLCPADMVLHSAAHLFYDGAVADGLRDLIDIHQMLAHFGRDEGFWCMLPLRAQRLELTRPLYYALHFGSRLLATPIPAETMANACTNGAPGAVTRHIMDALVERVLVPSLPDTRGTPLSAWLLYVRSHWLRMPPWLLARHLGRKAWRRAKSALPAPT